MRTTEPMQLDIYVNVHIHRIPLGSTPLLIRGMATGGGDRRQEPHIHHLSRCPGRPSPSVQAPGCSQGWQPGHNQDSGVCTSQQTTPRSRLRPWTSLPKTTWDPSSLLGRRYLRLQDRRCLSGTFSHRSHLTPSACTQQRCFRLNFLVEGGINTTAEGRGREPRQTQHLAAALAPLCCCFSKNKKSVDI